MDTNQFWGIIETAKRQADGDLDQQYTLTINALAVLDAAEIMRWKQIFGVYQQLSYKDKLWAAAYVINGGCSDDGFDYFRGWLTAQGKDVFFAALRDPDSLANLEELDEDGAEFEDMLSVACEAYFRKLNMGRDYAAFYKEAERYPLSESEKAALSAEIQYAEDIAVKWKEDALPQLLPRLCKKFEW